MELLILLLLVALGGYFLFKLIGQASVPTYSTSTPAQLTETSSQPLVNKADASVTENPLDVNHDGKVDLKDVVEVVKKTRSRVKKTTDQPKDSKTTTKEVKVTASKAKPKNKTVVTAKPRGRTKKSV